MNSENTTVVIEEISETPVNTRGEAYRVNVYFMDGMPVTRNLRDKVESIRRAYRRLKQPETDLMIYKNLDIYTAGGYMCKMQRSPKKPILLQTRAGKLDYYVAPDTLLNSLNNGFIPVVDEK
jgi:hypothetical protein